MESKKCSKCWEEKGVSEFYIRKTGPRAGEYYEKCKQCMRDRGVDYYHLNKERQLPLALKRIGQYKERRRKLLIQLKNMACFDCGKYYPPWVMEYDHKDASDKLGNISTKFVGGWWNEVKLMAEIAKCQLVCANCHRNRTYKRGPKTLDLIISRLKLEGISFLWENENMPS